jgi:hypothetical protein
MFFVILALSAQAAELQNIPLLLTDPIPKNLEQEMLQQSHSVHLARERSKEDRKHALSPPPMFLQRYYVKSVQPVA